MAFTVSHIADDTVFGNQRIQHLRVTADGATGSFDTGFGVVLGASYCPQSMTTGSPKIAINEGVAGTSTLGTIGITGVANGDEMLLTIFGR